MVRRPSTLLREPYVGTAQPCGTSVHVRYAAPVPKRLGVDVVRPWSAWWGRPGRCCVFSSLMWPRRRRARPSTSYLCKLSVLVTLLLTMKAYRALHRSHPPAHTKLHGCSPVYVLSLTFIHPIHPSSSHRITAHTSSATAWRSQSRCRWRFRRRSARSGMRHVVLHDYVGHLRGLHSQ